MSQSLGEGLTLTAADVARFRARVLATATCAVWLGSVGSDGYGRFAVRRDDGARRVVTPHQVAATLAFGQIPAGATVMHDCDVRLCCRTGPGHVQIATQAENIAQAVARGRACGPRPGMVDVRGPAGESRAIQAALTAAWMAEQRAQQQALTEVLAKVIADGDPRAGLYPMFDLDGLVAAR